MSPHPLVSVITIVYNGEKHLEKTIKSVLSQTYPFIEYIIIDGGSTDNSLEIIKRYADQISYWESKIDKGISDAFNKGILKATGEFIGLINADDWYEINAIEKVVQSMSGNDIIYGKLQYWKNGKKDMLSEGNEKYLVNEMSINHPTVFIRTECYKKYGLFNQNYKYAMDYELVLRLKLINCKFKYLPEVLANMRWHGVSDHQWLKACKEVLAIKNLYLPKRKIINHLYFYKQAFAIGLGRTLEKMHLFKITQFYRNRFSLIRKTYN